MTLSNKSKDILFLSCVLFFVFCFILGFTCYVVSLFAEETKMSDSDIAKQNKYYAEETIRYELEYQKMWEYTENMTPEEYANTFFKGEL